MSTLSPPFIIRRLLLNLEQYIPDIQTKKITEHLLLLHYQLLNFKNKKINKKIITHHTQANDGHHGKVHDKANFAFARVEEFGAE